MKRTLVTTALFLAVSLMPLALGSGNQTPPDEAPSKVRIGVYDNRPVALAYARSQYNPVSSKMREYEKAKAAGDELLIKELEHWGESHQRQLHRQGFGRVPVTDLLEPVIDQLPALARKLAVDVIVFECNYADSDVEIIDVTRDIIALYGLSDEEIEQSLEILEHEPVDLDDIRHDH